MLSRPVSPHLITLLFGLTALFFLARSLLILVVHTIGFHRILGFHSISYDFYLSRFVLFSILPWGFNAIFATLFGMSFGKRIGLGIQPESPRLVARLLRLAPPLLAYLAWWLVFNLPAFLQGDASSQGAAHTFPPRLWFAPVAREMSLFVQMGNYGLFTGFPLGVALQGLRRRKQ